MKNKKNEKNDADVDKALNEMFQAMLGYVLLEKVKHDPELYKATRKKVIKELEKTDLWNEVIVRPSKEN